MLLSLQSTSIQSLIGYTWQALGLVWLAGMAFTKPTLRAQPHGPRLFHSALVLLGLFLLGSTSLARGWLAIRFLPDNPAVGFAALAITIAGCLFAVWARVTLGDNWSGRATVKAGHQLITNGPYALARHPITPGSCSPPLAPPWPPASCALRSACFSSCSDSSSK